MKSWKEALIGPEITLREAMDTINQVGCQIALVVDLQRRLLGTLSDGDARRALLSGLNLSDPVSAVMHTTPTCVRAEDDRDTRLALMRRLGVRQLPVLNFQNIVVGLEIIDDYFSVPARDEWVVIMAGGLGSRLKELTHDTPKPMLKVGSRPLLETIVRGYADQGFRNFYLAVNYMAEQIDSHFGDGSLLGVNITYLREQQRMGTAGALSLLSPQPTQPIIVTNADLLTNVNYGQMLDKHVAVSADATMAVRDYEMQVPFGVVHECDGKINMIEEKPVQRFVVNAGMYVLSPNVLKLVPPHQFFDMPSLFEAVMRADMAVRCHRIDGYWLDIGRFHDYERANLDFDEVFR
jgi:dTDP-glucose pyrophosphorylase